MYISIYTPAPAWPPAQPPQRFKRFHKSFESLRGSSLWNLKRFPEIFWDSRGWPQNL